MSVALWLYGCTIISRFSNIQGPIQPAIMMPGQNALPKRQRIFYMASLTDTAGYMKTVDYPVMDHWGGRQGGQPVNQPGGHTQVQTPIVALQRHHLYAKYIHVAKYKTVEMTCI